MVILQVYRHNTSHLLYKQTEIILFCCTLLLSDFIDSDISRMTYTMLCECVVRYALFALALMYYKLQYVLQSFYICKCNSNREQLYVFLHSCSE